MIVNLLLLSFSLFWTMETGSDKNNLTSWSMHLLSEHLFGVVTTRLRSAFTRPPQRPVSIPTVFHLPAQPVKWDQSEVTWAVGAFQCNASCLTAVFHQFRVCLPCPDPSVKEPLTCTDPHSLNTSVLPRNKQNCRALHTCSVTNTNVYNMRNGAGFCQRGQDSWDMWNVGCGQKTWSSVWIGGRLASASKCKWMAEVSEQSRCLWPARSATCHLRNTRGVTEFVP